MLYVTSATRPLIPPTCAGRGPGSGAALAGAGARAPSVRRALAAPLRRHRPPSLQNPETGVGPGGPAAAPRSWPRPPAVVAGGARLGCRTGRWSTSPSATVYNRDLSVFATVLEGLREEPVSVDGGRSEPLTIPRHWVRSRCNIAVHRCVRRRSCCRTAPRRSSTAGLARCRRQAAGSPMLCRRREPTDGDADRDVAAGAGLARPGRASAWRSCTATAVLDEPGYRLAARGDRREIAAMPTPARGARLDHPATSPETGWRTQGIVEAYR